MGDEVSGVVTSVFGQTSSTVRELMRSLRDGNVTDAKTGRIGFVPFDRFVSKEVAQEITDLLTGLENGEIKTNIPAEKP